MSKPDFQQMSRQELKKYVLAHRDDDEAIRELFINRWRKNAIHVPVDMPLQQQEAFLKEHLEKRRNQ